jgi:glycosyltransferase involved in cell wall biosynthesis
MRVALLSFNARAHDAIGNHIAETAAFFVDRGAAVRVFVQSTDGLHPDVRACSQQVDAIEPSGTVWSYLAGADLVIAQYSQAFDLLQFLPMLAGGKPRLLLDYHSVTPPEWASGPQREVLEKGLRRRGLIWCVDAAIAHSAYTRHELISATAFPAERIHRLPLVVDGNRFHLGVDRWLHDRLGLDKAEFLLYVGRLAANKRVPLLVEALAHVPAHVHAVVIGETTDVYAMEAERCRARARDLNIADRLHVLGPLDDAELARAYRSADVLVMPSRHEGFCVPVVEAMASGLPVVASRSAALPETVGDAGLTFVPENAADLGQQVQRILPSQASDAASIPRRVREGDGRYRVAIVSFRFGADVVGGAETSLRTIADTLHSAGHHVEVFATCTHSESTWRNELPAGTSTCHGLTVHRFPIDRHDRTAHLESIRAIIAEHGEPTAEAEARYLRHSIHSSALVNALAMQAGEIDAIVVGPYLFGLTYDVAQAFPDRTLLLPCFHDEPIAWLKAWPTVYGRVGGVLLHSPEERELALGRLGVNGANVIVVGAFVSADRVQPQAGASRDYVVYCGRYSDQKNLPLLLDWMRRYQEQRPGQLALVCMGEGDVRLPREPWLHDLGRVDEQRKRAVLAGARALVQLSRQESLSLVVLEAWAQETPVIVHADCAVLAGQVCRARGGVAVADDAAFARALDGLPESGAAWGRSGRAYVFERYASREALASRLEQAIANLDVPLREQMRRRGLERAARCDRAPWRAELGRIVDDLLDEGPRSHAPAILVKPLHDEVYIAAGAHTALVAVRILNEGTHAAVTEGPGRTILQAEVRDRYTGAVLGTETTELPGLLVPGAAQTAMLRVPVPASCGFYAVSLGAVGFAPAEMRLHVGESDGMSDRFPLLDGIRKLLLEARQCQRLPADYVDVTQGWFARCKRWIKRKLLHNFKHAYVDVLSRQQSQLNRQLVAAAEQLVETCAMLDHAVRELQRRLDQCDERENLDDARSRSERTTAVHGGNNP